ncbi:MAG: hypothetical protein ACRENI_02295 [Gemmatimonadaceae bacterium]
MEQSQDPFLGRVLTDPATGLPNAPYFRLIRDWEQRRAQRRSYAVRVLTVSVSGGDERVRRSLSWRLCQDLRDSDLIASDGEGRFRILLTSPDAENADAICARISEIANEINIRTPSRHTLAMSVEVDPEIPARTCGPCEPIDDAELHSGPYPAIDGEDADATPPGGSPSRE